MSEDDDKVKSDSLPPQNLEAERATLGSILLDNDVLKDIVPFLHVTDFYCEQHRILYGVICEMHANQEPVDAITLADELIHRDQFKKIGGDETLKEIVDSVYHAANGKYYAGIVVERAIARRSLLPRVAIAPMFGDVNLGGDGEGNGLQCPFCDLEYVQFGRPYQIDGQDNYKAGWGGRGDLLVIPFYGECGSRWELCFGFHKGSTDSFLRVSVDCRDLPKEEPTLTYQEYLASPAWKEKAEAEKERAGQRCQVCNMPRSKTILDTHHRTYERLGHEEPGDLIVLCRDCHQLFHENGRLAR
jgi:hypothetical protein